MPVKFLKKPALQLTANDTPNQPADVDQKEYPFKFDDVCEGKLRSIYVSAPLCDWVTLSGEITASAVIAHLGGNDETASSADLLKEFHGQMKSALNSDAEVGFKYTNQVKNFQVGGAKVGIRQAPSTIGISKKPQPGGFRVRMEFNPRRIGPSGLADVEKAWNELTFGLSLDVWLASARVSRFDAAVDLLNVPVSDLILKHDNTHKQSAYFSAAGRLESWTLNKLTSKASGKVAPYITAYDKRQERKDKGKVPKHGETEHIRIEVRTRNANRPLRQLGSLTNPLAGLRIGSISQTTMSCEFPQAWPSFSAIALREGINAAEAHFPNDAKKLRSLFETSQSSFWDPQAAWSLWLQHPSDAGLSLWIERAQKAHLKALVGGYT